MPNTVTEKEVFEFLEDLRESGTTNMFGAGPYVQKKFRMNKHEAKDWVLKWMNSYEEK